MIFCSTLRLSCLLSSLAFDLEADFVSHANNRACLRSRQTNQRCSEARNEDSLTYASACCLLFVKCGRSNVWKC